MARSHIRAGCVLLLSCTLLLAACGSHVGTSTRQPSPTPTGPIASNLPTGVCAPTYQDLRNPEATKIEAKLVTIDTLSASDPDFPPGWKSPPRSTYFWVVAELGAFTVRPHSITGYASPRTFELALGYIQATSDPSDPETLVHPCRSIGGSMSNASWPSWFDEMSALIDVKIR